MQILSDLQRQRETILHSRDTLHTVRAAAARAWRLQTCAAAYSISLFGSSERFTQPAPPTTAPWLAD